MYPVKLYPATLIKRYKRFLADVILDNGEQRTIYCPNTGSMRHCGAAGDRIWYSVSDNTKRKYPETWEVVEHQGETICIHSVRANQAVAEALAKQLIPELTGYVSIKSEQAYAQNSRIDFLLSEHHTDPSCCYVEVKSCTLLEQGQGYFPDAVSTRGQKHLQDLIAMKQQGHRAVLLFAILHSGINSVLAAKHIDPDYAKLLEKAQQAGVEVVTFKATNLFQL